MSVHDSAQAAMAEVLEAAYAALRPWAKEVLRLLVARFGPLPAEQEELTRLALQEGLSGAHVRASLRLLQSCGLVHAVPKAWMEHQYRVLEGHLTFWQEKLFPRLEPEPEETGFSGAGIRNEPGDAVKDVLQVLLAASRGELKLLKSGGLSGQSVHRLEQVLLARDEELEACGLAGAAPHRYGPAVAAAVHMAAASGLLQVESGLVRPAGEAASAWLGKPGRVLHQELYAIWRKAVAPTFSGWEFHAMYAVEMAVPGRWYPLNHLFDWLRVCGMMDLDCMAQMGFISTRLVPLGAWGWLCLEQRDSGMAFMLPAPVAALREKELEPRFAGIIVQPDLEIIVPPNPPPELWWALLHWGEWTVRGEISVFRLTPRSLSAGRTAGGSVEVLLGQLRDYSKVDIDEGVTRFVREQAAVRSADSAAGPGILAKEPPGPVRTLEPLFAGVTAEDGLVGEPGEVYPAAPEPEPLPAGVPAAWWTQGRRGHPSTEKEMVRRAIAMKTALRVGTAGGEVLLVPLRIFEEAEDWELYGMQGRLEVRLKPHEWTGLRLVWPGIHE
jgi:hypothetical protein